MEIGFPKRHHASFGRNIGNTAVPPVPRMKVKRAMRKGFRIIQFKFDFKAGILVQVNRLVKRSVNRNAVGIRMVFKRDIEFGSFRFCRLYTL